MCVLVGGVDHTTYLKSTEDNLAQHFVFFFFFFLSVPSSGCQKLIGRLLVIFHKMCVRARLRVRVIAVESAG